MNGWRSAAAGLALAVTVAMSGCSGAPQPAKPSAAPAANAYGPMIDQYLQLATTDFEREVLTRAKQTGKVAEADYKEAVNRFVQCMNGKGYRMSAVADPATGLFTYRTEGDVDKDANNAAFEECSKGNTMLIEALYSSMVTNPNLEDPVELIVRCLIRKGVYPEGFTKEDYNRAAQNVPNMDPSDPFLSEAASACAANPSTP